MLSNVGGLNKRLVNMLIEKKLKISTAESCTGGLLSALITEVSGASEIFEETIVTYSNEAKMRELGVREETLIRYGAVSYDTAHQMCTGICDHTGAEVGIGITGIAGPGGGTKDKPVGTVYIGVCVLGDVKVKEMHFGGSREKVRESACITALETALEMLDTKNV